MKSSSLLIDSEAKIIPNAFLQNFILHAPKCILAELHAGKDKLLLKDK